MRLLDFFFKICYAPFATYSTIGKTIAIFTLSPPLAFVLMGGVNLLIYFLRPVANIRLSSWGVAITVMVLVALISYLLDRIYVKGGRVLGKNYHPLSGLLILIFIPGSIILYAMTFKYT